MISLRSVAYHYGTGRYHMYVYVTRYFVTLHDLIRVPELILGMGSANERRRYDVATSLIGWPHTKGDPWCSAEYPTFETWHSDQNGRYLPDDAVNYIFLIEHFLYFWNFSEVCFWGPNWR